ncbi:MAG: YIP1 family protein [Firmicutes bacterium]|nr:YIP1 family protein [Bacillota bacterium]
MPNDQTDEALESVGKSTSRRTKASNTKPEDTKLKRTTRQTGTKTSNNAQQDIPGNIADPSDNIADDSSGDSAQTEPEKRDFVDLLYGVIAKPVPTLRYIAKTRLIAQGIALFIAVAWITSIASIPSQYYLFKLMPDSTGEADIFSRLSIIMPLIVAPFLAIAGLAIISGIYHGLAKLFKGDGSYGSLISTLSFASFPRLFAVPFSLIVLFGGRTGSFPTFFISMIIFALVSQAFAIWVIVLDIIVIRENYRLSTGKATLVYFIPVIAFIILVSIVFFGFVLLAISIGGAGKIS